MQEKISLIEVNLIQHTIVKWQNLLWYNFHSSFLLWLENEKSLGFLFALLENVSEM